MTQNESILYIKSWVKLVFLNLFLDIGLLGMILKKLIRSEEHTSELQSP